MACANCSATEGNSDESSEPIKLKGDAHCAPPSFFLSNINALVPSLQSLASFKTPGDIFGPGHVVRKPEVAGLLLLCCKSF
jgi:hypothetical protein